MSTTRYAALAVLALVALAAGPRAIAQQASYLAANCANCHGTDGRSAGGGGMPGLAGLSNAYFIEQMKLFREGRRQSTIMDQIAKGYTDEQIAVLADYFSKQSASPGQGASNQR